MIKLARERGVIDGHTGYARFIILGRSRTGSNFLRGLLNSHSQVMVFGELFQNRENIKWAYPGYRQTRRMIAAMQRDPAEFLETQVFGSVSRQIRAVGFKMFYYHARDPDWKCIWPYLQGQKELKVIHVKRRNMLRTHLSRQLAQRTNVWTDTTGAKAGAEPIHLDYEECLADFERTRRWEQAGDEFFADHPKLEVAYEDLSADYRGEMGRVQMFLGIDLETLVPETVKQSSMPLAQAIANYDVFQVRLAGTQWEAFLED